MNVYDNLLFNGFFSTRKCICLYKIVYVQGRTGLRGKMLCFLAQVPDIDFDPFLESDAGLPMYVGMCLFMFRN